MTDVNLLKFPIKPKRDIPEIMLDALVDWFGKDFKILQKEKERLLINVKVNETAIKFWAMQYGESIEVVEPTSLRDTIRTTAQAILDKILLT